jgi:hypothetical protein
MRRIQKEKIAIVTIQYGMDNIWTYYENHGQGISNQLSKPRGTIDETLTECLQKYVVLG